MRQYKCKHFAAYELVPKHIYNRFGEFAWTFLDKNALIALDSLRSKFGSMTVNDYHWGGNREWSGLRTPNSPYYSETSQHSFGRAFDCLFKDYTAEEVRQSILKNPELYYAKYINSIESDVSWLHFSTNNCDRIKVFKP